MADGKYFNGKRWVSAENFRRPPPGPAKPPRKQPPKPQPKETTNDDRN